MRVLMMRAEQDIAEGLEFQLSLLRLAEIATTNRGTTPETTQTGELEQMLEKVPVRKRRNEMLPPAA